MATRWHSFEPTQFFPAPIRNASAALNSALGTVAKAGKVVERALTAAAAVANVQPANPVEAAVRTTLAQIDRYITGLIGYTQCHAIVIPVRKRIGRRGPADILSRFDDFLSPSTSGYTFVQNSLATKAGPGVFFRTLVESVADGGDFCRPIFPSDYAVTGACVLVGAESLRDLAAPFHLFSTLFVGNQRLAPAATILPVVQNLRVMPTAVKGGTGVVLHWDPVPPVNNAPLFSDDVIVSKEIFLIRTVKPFQQGFLHWDDLFNGQQPSDSRSDLPSTNESRVIARIRNHGFITSHVSDEDLLNPLRTYYFAACVRYTMNGVVQPMGPLSNVVRVTRIQPLPSSRLAIPPDWIATPNFAALFPPLALAINRIRLTASHLGAFTTNNTGGQQLLSQTVEQIRRLATQWEATIVQTEEITARLQAITAINAPGGMYATVITNPSGGINGWLSELAQRMSDTTDPSRPQLSDQSLVLGFVVVAGAPRLPDLSAMTALFNMFFGSHPKNPLFDILQTMDGKPAPAPTTPAAPAPILGYDPALNPSTTPTC